MIPSVKIPAALAALAFSVAPVAAKQDASAEPLAPVPSVPEVAAASDLMDLAVVDADDAPVGTTRDLVLDETRGSLLLVVESDADGLLRGLPLQHVESVVPEAESASGPVDHLRLRTPTDDRAPAVQDVLELDQTWLVRTRAHFAGTSADEDGLQAPDESAEPVLRFSALRGLAITGPEQQELATLDDLAVHLRRAELAYAIVAERASPSMLHGVPWTSLHVDLAGESAQMAIDAETLAAQPALDKHRLPPGIRADFSAADRLPPAPPRARGS